MSIVAERQSGNLVKLSTDFINPKQLAKLPKVFCEFIDVTGTATARSTFYNTKEEQQKAVLATHKKLFEIDRGIYGISLLLGTTDYSVQMGLGYLLDNPRSGQAFLNAEHEAKLIVYLAGKLPPQRMLKLYGEFRRERINNKRTRKLILRSILGSKSLEFWAVKYRQKLKSAIEHAWGKRTTGIIRSILAKSLHGSTLSTKETRILAQNVHKYGGQDINQPVAFALGIEHGLTAPLLSAYVSAKLDLSKGKGIPLEVLHGIRAHFHKDDYTKEDVFKMAAKSGSLTNKQKMLVQKQAKKAGIKVEFDPMKQDAVSLYIHAFECGLDGRIQEAMDSKAEKSADRMPIRYSKISIVVDTSDSTRGSDTQSLRPIAISLATRDMLVASANEANVIYAGEVDESDRMPRPKGDTRLAEALVEALQQEPDAVYILTDGYENSPAGRTDEVVNIVRKMGNTTPIFQVTPVMAAESKGIKQLSKKISTMPVNKPESIGASMIKGLIEQDLSQGLLGIARVALPIIGLEVDENG